MQFDFMDLSDFYLCFRDTIHLEVRSVDWATQNVDAALGSSVLQHFANAILLDLVW